MLVMPPAFLGQLHLQVDATVGLAVDHGCPVVNPNPRLRCMLAELLAVLSYSQLQPADEHGWVDAPVVGDELL